MCRVPLAPGVLVTLLGLAGVADAAAGPVAAPMPRELTGAARAEAIDQLQAMRRDLRTHTSGTGVATVHSRDESASPSFHGHSAEDCSVSFAFDAQASLIRITDNDQSIGLTMARLCSGHVEVALRRDTARQADGPAIRRVWSIDRWSDRAVVPEGKPAARAAFAGWSTDDWTYGQLTAIPDGADEDHLFLLARRGSFRVSRDGPDLVLYEEHQSRRFGKFSQEYVFSLSQGGVPVRATFHRGNDQTETRSIEWTQSLAGVVPKTYTVRTVASNAATKYWHVVQRDVVFEKFDLGPVPPDLLCVRALGGASGIPPGTSVIDFADQQPGHPPPSFIYSEPTWKRMFGEDPARRTGVGP